MIVRIYRVLINPVFRDEFESEFQNVARDFIAGREGLLSVTIGRPVEFAPDTYLMITNWSDADAVKKFAGENWSEPVIPDHMKKYTRDCWLDHFESF